MRYNEADATDEIDASVRRVMNDEGCSYGEAMEMLNVGNVAVFERDARHGGIEQFFGPEEERLAALRREIGSHDARRFVPSNAGVYDEFERRIRELQRQGLSLVDATSKALAEQVSVDRMDADQIPARAVDAYLGASIGSLMATYRRSDRSSRSGGRKAKKKSPSSEAQAEDRESRYQRAQWSADRSVSRALRAAVAA